MKWLEFNIVEIQALWLSHIEIWSVYFNNEFSAFSLVAEWIAEMLFMLLCAYIAV